MNLQELYAKITCNGMREMTFERFEEAVNEINKDMPKIEGMPKKQPCELIIKKFCLNSGEIKIKEEHTSYKD